jgi:two-component system sensor histidine kinase DegS
MDAARADASDGRDPRLDGLRAEAGAAVGHTAATVRSIRERYREAYIAKLAAWQALANEVDEARRSSGAPRPRLVEGSDRISPDAESPALADDEATAALRRRQAEVEALGVELNRAQTELAKLEVALRNLDTTWRFLDRGDASLVATDDAISADVQMQIVEAQESERSRLAQEIHDGPAQALANAIFQVEYLEKLIDQDPRLARTELRYLRELLRRELGDVRTFITRLRPPLLDELGLEGALADAVETFGATTDVSIGSTLDAPAGRLTEAQQTVVLRVLQESLQNIRKHAAASVVSVTTSLEGDDWVLEVRDDGRGFDTAAVDSRTRRSFGLQFMRERAQLVGARLEVRSRPDGGTLVQLTMPVGEAEDLA